LNDVPAFVRTQPAGPRRRNAEATRAAILAAAKDQFARLGYDSATLRGIAGAAGADVALIKRYFGGKDGLFTEALKASFQPHRMATLNRATYAREVALAMAGDPHGDEERTHVFRFLLRAATSPTTLPLLNVAIQERYLGPIRDWLGGDDAQARARVLASILIGLLVERLIRDEPLAGRERDVVIDRVTQAVDALIAG